MLPLHRKNFGMGANQSVQVANAFPQDIYVKVRTEKITEYQASTSFAGQTEISHRELSIQGRFGLQSNKESKTNYQILIDAGFSVMPKAALTTFKPPSNPTKTVYLTVLYYDSEGNERKIAEDVPYGENQSVIVTGTGGIVDAKDSRYPWIDLNGVDHSQNTCELCSTISSVCSFCMVDSRLKEIQYSLGVVQDCRLAKSLVRTIANAKENSVVQKQNEAKEMMKEIENLARSYWTLETKTKRAVGNVKVYGKSLKEAAVDYLEDGVLSDFWNELSDVNEAKKELEKVNEHHESIKGEVCALQEKANVRSKNFQERARAAAEYNDDMGAVMSIISAPVVGQLMGGVGGGIAGGMLAAELCEKSNWTNNIPVKVVAGIAGGVASAAIGLVSSIITLPAAPIFWYKSISSDIDAKNYGTLKEQFGNIALQMGLVEKHLGKITHSLHDIEENLQLCQRAEERAIAAMDDEKRRKMVEKVLKRAEHLLRACEYYSSIVNDKDIDRALGM